jgi:uncharacterized protein DUF1259
MKNFCGFLAALCMLASPARADSGIDTAAIAGALGRIGTESGTVYRVSFPRSDLKVRIGNVALLPGFALGGYAAFFPGPGGALAAGDLVLLEDEIQPVMLSLQHSGFEITALHNHLRNESPHVMYLHFMAEGDAVALARSLRAALALSRTPLGPVQPAAPKSLAFQSAIETTIGRTGKVNGSVLSFSIPRPETITMNGTAVPPAAGVATAINIEDAGDGRVAAMGDFVLVGSEVHAVQQALLAHNFEVTAIHSHMIDDSPHLYYMHFWAVGSPAAIAGGLKAALALVRTS